MSVQQQAPPLDLLIQKLFGADASSGTSSPRRLARAFFEGLLYTGIALGLARVSQLPHAGPLAVFVTAAGLTRRFETFLDQERRALSASKILFLFSGMLAAFATFALLTSELRAGAEFQFVIDSAQLGKDTILTRRFGAAPGLFFHNAIVLSVLMTLAFAYRAFGALLALSWNACIWGLVLTFLVRRGMTHSETHPLVFVPIAVLAVLPHLLLEAAGYVIGSLAAISLSRAVTRASSEDFRQVLRDGVKLAGIALACLGLGALVESTLPRLVLSLLSG